MIRPNEKSHIITQKKKKKRKRHQKNSAGLVDKIFMSSTPEVTHCWCTYVFLMKCFIHSFKSHFYTEFIFIQYTSLFFF